MGVTPTVGCGPYRGDAPRARPQPTLIRVAGELPVAHADQVIARLRAMLQIEGRVAVEFPDFVAGISQCLARRTTFRRVVGEDDVSRALAQHTRQTVAVYH